MKKTVSLLLCVIMVLAAFTGCGPQQPAESTGETTAPKLEHVLSVGYGRVDITPKESLPLGGLSNSVVGGSTSDRMHTGVENPLYATCIAISDETGNTILLFHMDFLLSYASKLVIAKMAVARATGVNGNQIMITSTHNHSAPDLYSTMGQIEDYIDALKGWMVEAAETAMADRKPAKMYTTSTNPEGMNFCRHYLMSDGGYAGDNFGNKTGVSYVKHVVEADNQMQLVKFTREGAKDIVMMNWQAHPTGHSGEYRSKILSHVDETRKVVEKELDCHFAYFLGASGNVNSTSRISGEQATVTDGVYYKAHGQKLGMIAAEAAANFQQVQTDSIRFLSKNYEAKRYNDDTSMANIPMYAFSFGDVAFVTAPYEMFTEHGKAIKEGSPYKTTIVATCSNEGDYLAYLAAEYAFDYNSYEAQMARVAKGTAEIMQNEYINLLKELAGNG